MFVYFPKSFRIFIESSVELDVIVIVDHRMIDMSVTENRQKHEVEKGCQFVHSIKGSQVQ
jgi:hypothetical protein